MINRWLTPLELELTDERWGGRPVWRLHEGFDVELGGWSALTLTVPAGFMSDLASTPRVLWRVFAPSDSIRAAVVHDYLYSSVAGMSRWMADAIFVELMSFEGVPRWRRTAGWLCLRMFGWSSFRKR